ncbi:protein NRT1/ PTR FAMILY 8.1 [Quercus suber]|uniref:protein NRT1/ PTR FAMILY 8.1 n=1 Tax=Quercus suber TaxID=58331 RepID=UPI000CE226D3|nr:protein NRT1/ PTR FAMILY 8.1-like [Quercus suber]
MADISAVTTLQFSYLMHNWENQHLPKAAAVINNQNGLTSVLAIIVAYVADTCTGLFNMIFFSTVSHIVGLALYWISARFPSPNTNIGLFYATALAVALGRSSRVPVLKAFLAVQFRRENPNVVDEGGISYLTNAWWLDKAALIEETSSISQEEQENLGRLCTVKQVKDVKHHLKLIPMWATLFAFGLMLGLASKGLEKFISNHVSKSMRRYGPIFSNFVTGLGNFFSIPFVLLFKSWFRETINTSHLDRYYLALAILSSVFLCIYLCVLPISAGMEDLLEDMESDDRGLEDVTLD